MKPDVRRVGVPVERHLEHAVVETRPCGFRVDVGGQVRTRAERAGIGRGTDRHGSAVAPDVDVPPFGIGDVGDDADLVVVLVDVDRC